MSAVDPLRDADPAWVVLTLAIVTLAAVPVLRWLAPAARRHRGGGAFPIDGEDLGATSPELAHQLSAIIAAPQSAPRAASDGEPKPAARLGV